MAYSFKTHGTMFEAKPSMRRRIAGSYKNAFEFTFDNDLRLEIAR